jgi:N utilization substance protein B
MKRKMENINSAKILSRTIARLAAIQVNYAQEQNSEKIDIIKFYEDQNLLEDLETENKLIEPDQIYLKKLTDNMTNNLAQIDSIISEYLTKSNIEKLDLVIKSILRAAVCEMTLFADVPTKVIINEYTNIANSFVDANETGFINSVLDKVAKRVRS